MVKKIRITWVKSSIGSISRHRRTIKALGLRRLHHEVVKEASPQVVGMAQSVIHLLKVEEVES